MRINPELMSGCSSLVASSFPPFTDTLKSSRLPEAIGMASYLESSRGGSADLNREMGECYWSGVPIMQCDKKVLDAIATGVIKKVRPTDPST